MPGFGSRYEGAWIEGKPPRYWGVFLGAFLLFVALWVVVAINRQHLSSGHADSWHSVARTYDGHTQYFPAAVVWLMDYGLFVVMAWVFFLGLVAAFKRTLVRKQDR